MLWAAELQQKGLLKLGRYRPFVVLFDNYVSNHVCTQNAEAKNSREGWEDNMISL